MAVGGVSVPSSVSSEVFNITAARQRGSLKADSLSNSFLTGSELGRVRVRYMSL